MRKTGLFLLSASLCLLAAPGSVHAQGAAPELFGIREVVVEYTRFDDPKASDICGLTREQIATALVKALAGTNVPAIATIDAKPPMMGVARVQLVPTISTHVGDNMDCVSWLSLSAESHANVVIQPVNMARSVTAVYWRQHSKVATGQSTHEVKVRETMVKLAEQFSQQYRLDQPPELRK